MVHGNSGRGVAITPLPAFWGISLFLAPLGFISVISESGRSHNPAIETISLHAECDSGFNQGLDRHCRRNGGGVSSRWGSAGVRHARSFRGLLLKSDTYCSNSSRRTLRKSFPSGRNSLRRPLVFWFPHRFRRGTLPSPRNSTERKGRKRPGKLFVYASGECPSRNGSHVPCSNRSRRRVAISKKRRRTRSPLVTCPCRTRGSSRSRSN